MDESYAEKKKRLSSENSVVKRPLPRIDKAVLPSAQRKNKKWSPAKVRNGINKYFEWCEQNDELPSISGMCIHMNWFEKAFYAYVKDERYRDILEQARMIIKSWAETDVYNTKGLATGKIAYMKNIHSWTEKTETTNTNVVIDMTPDQARARIEALAPKLLEALKSSTLLNQLVKDDTPLLIDVTPKEAGHEKIS